MPLKGSGRSARSKPVELSPAAKEPFRSLDLLSQRPLHYVMFLRYLLPRSFAQYLVRECQKFGGLCTITTCVLFHSLLH